MPSSTDTELENLIRARYPLIYIVSWEEERVEEALRTISRERGKKLYVWTVTQGFMRPGGQRDNTTRDPLAALDQFEPLCAALGPRATLKLFADADHSFHVPARSGGNDAQVLGDVLDALAAWIDGVLKAPAPAR